MDEIGEYPAEHPGATIARVSGASGLSAIPIAGSSLSNIFVELFQYPLTKSREAWFNTVSEAVNKLGVKIEDLAKDPEFVDVVVVATEVARSTSQQRKRQWLANAVANCSRESAPSQAGKLRYLRIMERLLPIHIEILRFVKDQKLSRKYESETNQWPKDSDVLAWEIPSLNGDEKYSRELFEDLVNLGLMRERSETFITSEMLDFDNPREVQYPDYELPEPEQRALELLDFIEIPKED